MRLFNETSLGLKLQSIGDLLNPKVLIEVFYREELEKKRKKN